MSISSMKAEVKTVEVGALLVETVAVEVETVLLPVDFFLFGSGCGGGYVVLFLEERGDIGQVVVEEVLAVLNDTIIILQFPFSCKKS